MCVCVCVCVYLRVLVYDIKRFVYWPAFCFRTIYYAKSTHFIYISRSHRVSHLCYIRFCKTIIDYT